MRVWLQMQHVQTSSLENENMLHNCESIKSDIASNNLIFVNVIEINSNGWVSRQRLRVDELVGYFVGPGDDSTKMRTAISCFRDLISFMRHNKHPMTTTQDGIATDGPKNPAIIPRPQLGFFLIDLHQLKVICWKDRCLVLDHDQSDMEPNGQGSFSMPNNTPKHHSNNSAMVVEVFTRNLSHALQTADRGIKGCAFDLSWHCDVIRECAMSQHQLVSPEIAPFEMLVLDNALHTIIGKLNRHLHMIKPIFNVLLEETVAKPSDKILRRILAFKKSLISFEVNVQSVENEINNFLSSDAEMSSLYLSEKRDSQEHEEVELLFEGYRLDLSEIQVANQTMLGQIDETKEFINTQLNEARNRIIRMSLNIEMCMLGLTFGACFASIFGMNLKSGLEDHYFAFYLTVGMIISLSALIIGLMIWRCVSIMNLSKMPTHPILKNFFKYVDILEFLNDNKSKQAITKEALDKQLMRLINKDISPEDVDLIFLIFDDKNRGVLKKNEFHDVMKRLSTYVKK